MIYAKDLHSVNFFSINRYCPSLLIYVFGLTPAPVSAYELGYAGLVEIDWDRSSLRDAGQRTLTIDPSIATFELALSANVTPQWSTNLVMLAEDIGVTDNADYMPTPGATDKRPDRLHIEEFTFGYSSNIFEAAVGRMTLPFGKLQTGLLSDPQVLVLGETSTEMGARALYRNGEAYLGGAIFDGNLRSVAPDETGYIAFVGWETEELLRNL